MKTWRTIRGWAAVAVLVSRAPALLACSACYGDPQAPMTKGLNLAILTLLGVTALVLSGVAAFIIVLARRARRHAKPPAGEHLATGVNP